MHMNKVIGLIVLLCCELCWTIKVPIIWNEGDNSEVYNEYNNKPETNKQQHVQTLQQSQSIPINYFQYTAKKPQFAVDVAVFHGVKEPEQHYKAYPVNPYTGKEKPVLGIHQLLNEDRNIYQPYQKYIQKVEKPIEHASPMSTDYEVFHPYKAEEPALQELYKDPILNKIRNDLHDSKNRLQAYEQEAGQPNVADDEYLEKVEETDAKLFPQQNIPARYEVHKTERRPIYYRVPPQYNHRDHVLNQRFKHPWNQHGIKIRPLHYKPLKNHLHLLRQHHAMKFNDEHNEYPQIQLNENISEPDDGYDIYEKGKQKYIQLRNNLDESINKAVQENKPVTYQKLELQPNESSPTDIDDEFVPVKNYAQVRKTETVKHVPKKAAFDDADTYEEILNAPRLREAIKSTKAQIVYSEEGYEDSAYDHAGEQKHASDHEGHGGFLKENAKSAGLYKIPSVVGGYQDGKGSEYRDDVEHLKQWENDAKDNDEDIKSEDYSEKEYDESIDADIYADKNIGVNNRNKRDDEKINKFSVDSIKKQVHIHNSSLAGSENNLTHEVDKRETNFEVPTINLKTTYLNEEDILKIAKQKLKPKKENMRDKYPYYFRSAKLINENSPLRYAENLKLMPRKTGGGTEFYDSRSKLQCPEVEDDVNPIPEKLKNDNNPTEVDTDESSGDHTKQNANKNNNTITNGPRLNGLGDKIDCFKAKYFGENPLDSPFFKEDTISNPTPIFPPTLHIFKHLKNKHKRINQNTLEDPYRATNTDIYVLLDKLRTNSTPVHESLSKLNGSLPTISQTTPNTWGVNNSQESNVYTDVLKTIKSDFKHPYGRDKVPASLVSSNRDVSNKTYIFFQNKEDVIQKPLKERKKRATPFVYEPYKIIRDSQYQDSKKTTTTSNISPLIRQLQTSKVVDRVSRSNRDDNKPTPKSSRTYVNIGKNDRAVSNTNPTIVDISIDQRRGEPRYEIRPSNHKSEYTPVENKRAISVEDYNIHRKPEQIGLNTVKPLSSTTINNGRQHFTTTTETPVYDVTSFLPKSQKVSASSTVQRTVRSTTQPSISKEIEKLKQISNEDTDDDEDNDENDEDEDYEIDEENEEEENDESENIVSTTVLPSTTTTTQPTSRTRGRISSTTEIISKQANADEPERLKLVTRFRNYKPSQKLENIQYTTVSPDMTRKFKLKEDSEEPKYTEKKKDVQKHLSNRYKKYGDDDNSDGVDTEEEKIDAMIGIKHNVNDYKPSYEQDTEINGRNRNSQAKKSSIDNEDGDDDDDDEDDSEEDDDEDGTEEEDDEDPEDEELEISYSKVQNTTPNPPKRTLVQTTEAPSPTIASHNVARLKAENKPIITRKRIEIHKELPVNKSGPHVTQFKQDIKEVEIIKEMPAPKRKVIRKERPLELYKDDNLAKDINKLEDVEVFRENLDRDKEPKHGGNYRRASKEDLKKVALSNDNHADTAATKDVEASQSENRKSVELDDYNPKQRRASQMHTKNDKTPGTRMHEGNVRHNGREGRRSAKLIELDDDRDDDDSTQDDDYKSSTHSSRHDRLHGGNYRSAKLVAEKGNNDDVKVNSPAREARRSATVLLNKYVQAAPALTTTPGYIVDPSKRMYYYVDV